MADIGEVFHQGGRNPLLQPLPPPNHGPDDPERMHLTEQEFEQAWTIRQAIEGMPEIDNLSDFMYCQLAIIEKDNVQAAVERAWQLQLFRQNYDIRDTVADGKKYIRKLMDLAPGFLMDFGFYDGAYSGFMNIKALEPKSFPNPTSADDLIKGYYYFHQCGTLDFKTIRDGVTMHIECGGYEWKKHLSPSFFQRVYEEFLVAYPVRFLAKYYHANSLFNVLLATVKRLYPEDRRRSFFEVGCVAPLPLDAIYLQPSVEAADRRMFAVLQACLIRRYENQQNFALQVNVPESESEEEGEEE
jgi:hypothetical protein